MKVFVSYSHDSVTHKKWVLDLTQKLRRDGIDAWIDRFVSSPPSGWPSWMRKQIEEADFVIAICTARYRDRFDGNDIGRGVRWESLIARQLLYENLGEKTTIVPVLKDGLADTCIPLDLRPFTYFDLPRNYNKLLRYLTGEPDVTPEPLGSLKAQPAAKKATVDLLPVRSQGLPAQPVEEVFAPEEENRFESIRDECDSMELISPLNCIVYHHAVVCEKYGLSAEKWDVIPIPNRPLDTSEGEFLEHKVFLVLVEISTREALALVSFVKLHIQDAIPNGTRIQAGDRIGSVLIPKNLQKNPWGVSRGTTYQEVLKYQPRIEDGVWSPTGPSAGQSGITILDSSSMADSGISRIRAPFAGIFHSATSRALPIGSSVSPGQEVGQIERNGSYYPVRSTASGPIVSHISRPGDAVYSGQTIISFRQDPPTITLRVSLTKSPLLGWHELLSPVCGKLSASGNPKPVDAQPGYRFDMGDLLCEVRTRNLTVQIASDSSGRIMEVLARKGDDIEIGQSLFLIRLESYLFRSPLIGTFYRAKKPGAPPYVTIGSEIDEGQVLCIVEAIKQETEIESTVSGLIETIFPQDGQGVEYGEPVFQIRTNRS